MTNSRPLPPTHRDAIREIFLRRRIEYSTKDVARLLRLNLGEVLAMIESGELHADVRRKRKQLGGPRLAWITWNELASTALLRWTVVQVHDALGKQANRVLPRLLRPVALKSLRLPEYQVRLLETLAREAGVSLEEFVFTSLVNLETFGTPEEIERLLPGYIEAIRFPDV
ncbi:MAG TPA: hypothetical protein VE974_19880 [Thermoanaerobaculia bacterium]|nr:hypothetical protein [Thermoanaerobaculia bacterium]